MNLPTIVITIPLYRDNDDGTVDYFTDEEKEEAIKTIGALDCICGYIVGENYVDNFKVDEDEELDDVDVNTYGMSDITHG